jgi:hypothetical protein
MLTSYRQERATELRRRKIFLGVFLVVITFALSREVVFGFLKKGAMLLAEPAWQVASSAQNSVQDLRNATIPRDALIAENASLKEKLSDLALEKQTINALRHENMQLRALGGRAIDDKRIIARVLSRPPQSAYDTFVIDAGIEEGVEEGMRALIGGNFLVGEVISVGAHTSLLRLASEAGVSTSGLLSESADEGTTTAPVFADSTSATGTASTSLSATTSLVALSDEAMASSSVSMRSSYTFVGLGGGGFRAMIPKQVSVARDEPVALPSESPSFLGLVTGIYLPPSGSLKEVYVTLPVGIGQIEWVSLAAALPENDASEISEKMGR